MFDYLFTYWGTFTDDFFFAYMGKYSIEGKEIIGVKAKDHKEITITTDLELTATEQEDLNNYIQAYSDYDQGVVDNTILDQCRLHGEILMRNFELMNMERKRVGQYETIDIMRVMEEIHDAFIFMSIYEEATRL